VHAPAPDGRITSVRKHQLQDKNYLIFVTAQAKVMGINMDLTDHKRYYLRRSLQVGRPVAVEPIVDGTRKGAERGERAWRGWDRFNDVSDYGVFVYGSMASPAEIGAILGHPAVEGVDYLRAHLRGWHRTWNVCTDNTTTTKVRYYTPGTDERPPVQVLFLTVEPDNERSVSGYILRVKVDHLMALDIREGNYNRVLVTGDISVDDGRAPAVVWTYVGKEARVAKARAAIMRGTARVRREYLDNVVAAFEGNHEMLAELQATLSPPPAPVESLDRQVG
jgi:gamma-glutamylcyclotransferase (GGCT)/AIG2-like uncharacterized protein YtfP